MSAERDLLSVDNEQKRDILVCDSGLTCGYLVVFSCGPQPGEVW